MSLCAIIPVSLLDAANNELELKGYGPGNFGVPLYQNGSVTYMGLHAAGDLPFEAAIKAIAGVIWEESNGDPMTRFNALVATQGLKWGGNAPALPTSGIVDAGSLYRWAGDNELYTVIQQYDIGIYGGDPNTYPALIIKTRDPYKLYTWYQTGQFNAFKVLNPVTGTNDECMFNGRHYYVTAGDGSGNNTWPPDGSGSYGWSEVDPSPLRQVWNWFRGLFK
jgi:hypothetical protein